MKNRKVITVEMPKEIWDAHHSLCNTFRNRDVIGAWRKSIDDVIKQYQEPEKKKKKDVTKPTSRN